MSATLQKFQALYEDEDDEAYRMLGELHESDPQAYLEIVAWYVDQGEFPNAVKAAP